MGLPHWHKGVLPVALALLLAAGALKFENNAYSDLLIAIHPDIPEDQIIISQLKQMVQDASPYLYRATGRRAYLGNVTILVPSSWSPQPQYQNTSDSALGFPEADVRVDVSNVAQPLMNAPYVFQPQQCGMPGRYVHLAPAFLTAVPGSFGNKGRVFVHEWAHYRYGVFDEYGDGDRYPYFYINDNNNLKPTQCMATGFLGTAVNKTDSRSPCTETAVSLRDCFFLINSSTSTARASIMYAQHVASVVSFCESRIGDTRHDSNANNQQNAMCRHATQGRGLSTWEVIEKHPDMTAVPLTSDQPPQPPNIRVVRKGNNSTCGRRLVLVMDVSESMVERDRWFKQNQAADKLIRDIVPVGAEVGIIVFNSQVMVKQNLTLLRDRSGRPAMTNNLPTDFDFWGFTAIGDALHRAWEMLTDGGKSGRGSRILLITDGILTRGRSISNVSSEIQAAGITVHTIAYGNDADPNLALLSQSTGGQYGYYSERGSSNLDGVMARLWPDLSLCDRPDQVTVHQETVNVTTDSERTGTISIDSDIGNNTLFVFTFPRLLSLKVEVTSPNRTSFNENAATYYWNSALSIIRVLIPGIAQAGTWGYRMYNISRNADSEVDVTVSVRSESRTSDPPIAMELWVGSTMLSAPAQFIYTYVHKGYSPVLNASVTVTVEQPSGQSVTLQPRDDGLVPDVKRGDGVYTIAMPVGVGGQGRYSLSAQVDTSTAQIPRLAVGSGALPAVPVPETPTVLEPAGNVTRVTSGGAFDVTNSSNVINNVINITDVTPPSPVTDLAVTSTNSSTRTVTLSWTSPGDDYSLGTASHYDVRMAASSSELQNNFTSAMRVTNDTLTSGSLTPLPGGSPHVITVTVQANWPAPVTVFAMKAVDEVNNTAFISNIVVTSFTPPTFDPETTLPPPTNATRSTDDVTPPDSSTSTLQSDVPTTVSVGADVTATSSTVNTSLSMTSTGMATSSTANTAVFMTSTGMAASSTANTAVSSASTGRNVLTSATSGSDVRSTIPAKENPNHTSERQTTHMTPRTSTGSEEPFPPEKSQLPVIVGSVLGALLVVVVAALVAVLVHKHLAKPKRRPSPSGCDPPERCHGWDKHAYTGSMASFSELHGDLGPRQNSAVSFQAITLFPAKPNGAPPQSVSLYPSLQDDHDNQNWGQRPAQFP